MVEKRNLYFIDSRGEYRILMADIEEHEAALAIHVFLDRHRFKSYYTRTWETEEGLMYDVGSHTEFFLWGFKRD
jgi:hypothetical protein